MDELQQIRSCLEGDIDSFAPLVRKYQETGLRLAYRFLKNWSDAQDALQDAFIKTYNNLDRFDPNRPFSTWFFRILVNTCKDRYRSKSRKRAYEYKELSEPNGSDPISDLAARDFLEKSLQTLPQRCARTFILVELEGFTNDEAADILRTSTSTVRVQLMKARSRLGKLYNREHQQ